MTTTKNQSTQPLPLVDVLQQCNNDGMNPNNITGWEACLQNVFQSRNYEDTAAGFVTAINQVWGPQVTAQMMLTAVTGLKNGLNVNPFTAADVQPLINGLLGTFLIRDNLNDVGGHSAPPYCISPDIINYGTNTLTVPEAAGTMSSYINATFDNGENNNMFIRAQNISGNAASGYVSLYSVPGSLLLTPQSWLPYGIAQPSSAENFCDQSGSAQIQPNEVCLTTTPFNYKGLPGGGHFCLIAIASGANGMPFPVPSDFSTNGSQAAWIEQNPNVSQRNMDYGYVSGTTGTISATLGNNNNTASIFVITLIPGSNQTFPEGTTISAVITDSRVPYSPPAQQWAPRGVPFYGLIVPANINGTPQSPLINITFTIQLPAGTSFNDTPPVLVNYYQIPSEQADETEQAVTHLYKIPARAHMMATAEMEDQQLIFLGTCQFTFQ